LIDALAPIGVTEVEMPATPACIWNAIEQAKLSASNLCNTN
jgi:hypothetical protein